MTIEDIEYVLFRHPDVPAARSFMTDYGLLDLATQDGRSYMRGYGDVDLWVDARADRIRRGRDGGFLVMRRTTFEDPMGRRMQILRPLEDEDE